LRPETPSAMLKTISTGASMSWRGSSAWPPAGRPHGRSFPARREWRRWSRVRRTRLRCRCRPWCHALDVVGGSRCAAARLGACAVPPAHSQTLAACRAGYHGAEGGFVVEAFARAGGKRAGAAFKRRQGVDLQQVDAAVLAEPEVDAAQIANAEGADGQLGQGTQARHHIALLIGAGSAPTRGWRRWISGGSRKC